MAILEVSCPKCGNTSKVSDELAGKKIRCKKCQNVISVGKPAAKGDAKPPGAKPPGPHDDDDRKPYIMKEENLAARCPFCAMQLDPPDARICIHCGYNMHKRHLIATKKTYERTPVDYLLWHLPTVGCFIGIGVLIGICVFCAISMNDWIDEDFPVKPGCFSVWIIVMSCFPIFFMGRFIFRRLVWHFAPEEKLMKETKEE